MKRISSLALCMLLSLLLLTSCGQADRPLSAAELLNLGEKYLLDLDYEQARVYFEMLIEIEPMNPRGYTGLAEAYVGIGDTEHAIAALNRGLRALPGNAEIAAMLERLDEEGTNNPAGQGAIQDPVNSPESTQETVPSVSPEPESTLSHPWRDEYVTLLKSHVGRFPDVSEWGVEQYPSFLLYDFDEDGIPEIIIADDTIAESSDSRYPSYIAAYTYKNGGVEQFTCETDFGRGMYAPPNNIPGIIVSDGGGGAYYLALFRLEGERLAAVFESLSWEDFDTLELFWTINGMRVTENEYDRAFIDVFGVPETEFHLYSDELYSSPIDEANITSIVYGWQPMGGRT